MDFDQIGYIGSPCGPIDASSSKCGIVSDITVCLPLWEMFVPIFFCFFVLHFFQCFFKSGCEWIIVKSCNVLGSVLKMTFMMYDSDYSQPS